MALFSLLNSSECHRRQANDLDRQDWCRWGTYLPDRQWGTIRECYTADLDAWKSFTHDQSRSRVYRWGEDGLLGFCDRDCLLCFAPAFWNGKDPILKERLFGLANHEGNHGEDVKEIYFHIMNTPTHSYSKALYVYPIQEYPYDDLVAENARRGRDQEDYCIEDTGIFAGNNVFHCFIEYAKQDVDDILIRITCVNLSTQAAPLTVLPTVWMRNTWAWGYPGTQRRSMKLASDNFVQIPTLSSTKCHENNLGQQASFPEMNFYCDQGDAWLFTDNETNTDRLYGVPNTEIYSKDAFHRYLIDGEMAAVNPKLEGTKAAMNCHRVLQPGESWTINCRLSAALQDNPFGDQYHVIFSRREHEADDFYLRYFGNQKLIGKNEYKLFVAASAGLLWSRKFYFFNVYRWLKGDPGLPLPPASRWHSDYANWKNLDAHDIFSMPDAWEYPYFCKWDLMFHAVAFAELDPKFAKRQCNILRTYRFVAPTAQVPAYEWAFSDVDPPIGAWAVWRTFAIDREVTDIADYDFLTSSHNSLAVEYGWWSNRNARSGSNLFDGGFLGLDNISPFDRRYPLPGGIRIEQADGTAWMAFLALYMLKISVALPDNLAQSENDSAARFCNDFLHLVNSLNAPSDRGYYSLDAKDHFYYDLLRFPDGSAKHIRVRSLTGVIPLLAVTSFSDEEIGRNQPLDVANLLTRYLQTHGLDDYALSLSHLGRYPSGRHLFSIASPLVLRQICRWLFDEQEFLSPYGIRALSKYYENNPYSIVLGGETYTLKYAPGQSPVPMFGGNSNWRGPIWIPINYLLIDALREYYRVLGDDFLIEYPTHSGSKATLMDIASDLENRILSIFLPDSDLSRPFTGKDSYLDGKPELNDLYLFHEYFNGDNGIGVGASHQTGWTAMVRRMILHKSGLVV